MTSSPRTIGAEQTLSHAAKEMEEHGFRHLPVLHGGQIFGILSDRDVGMISGLNEVNPDNTKCEEAATQVTYEVTPETPVGEVIANMASHKYGSALVVKQKKIVGIFTNHDAMNMLADMLK